MFLSIGNVDQKDFSSHRSRRGGDCWINSRCKFVERRDIRLSQLAAISSTSLTTNPIVGSHEDTIEFSDGHSPAGNGYALLIWLRYCPGSCFPLSLIPLLSEGQCARIAGFLTSRDPPTYRSYYKSPCTSRRIHNRCETNNSGSRNITGNNVQTNYGKSADHGIREGDSDDGSEDTNDSDADDNEGINDCRGNGNCATSWPYTNAISRRGNLPGNGLQDSTEHGTYPVAASSAFSSPQIEMPLTLPQSQFNPLSPSTSLQLQLFQTPRQIVPYPTPPCSPSAPLSNRNPFDEVYLSTEFDNRCRISGPSFASFVGGTFYEIP
ncbi:hypothetical protein E1B28_008137 [Marasmius oreades]|uniref:Uncharacterized protein n=1 Tax=Marasmius oreades TaxID=181124 RepID=A0A9P7RXT8_9AGAR|nr:uncharacterized protein E1B28_008137 [Marasmius oreades]KAG7091736.1 hypothetical protein E1B28_008137 [Marasmius oreades]